MNTHDYFMERAIAQADLGISQGHGGPFGSVVVRNGQIVGQGHNQVLLNNDPTCHGEVQAIRDACKNLGTFDLSGCQLYTTAAPCPMCLGAILWANISQVYTGCEIADTDAIGFRDDRFYEYFRKGDPSVLTVESVGREKCLELFDRYTAINGKGNY